VNGCDNKLSNYYLKVNSLCGQPEITFSRSLTQSCNFS